MYSHYVLKDIIVKRISHLIRPYKSSVRVEIKKKKYEKYFPDTLFFLSGAMND